MPLQYFTTTVRFSLHKDAFPIKRCVHPKTSEEIEDLCNINNLQSPLRIHSIKMLTRGGIWNFLINYVWIRKSSVFVEPIVHTTTPN